MLYSLLLWLLFLGLSSLTNANTSLQKGQQTFVLGQRANNLTLNLFSAVLCIYILSHSRWVWLPSILISYPSKTHQCWGVVNSGIGLWHWIGSLPTTCSVMAHWKDQCYWAHRLTPKGEKIPRWKARKKLGCTVCSSSSKLYSMLLYCYFLSFPITHHPFSVWFSVCLYPFRLMQDQSRGYYGVSNTLSLGNRLFFSVIERQGGLGALM